MYCKGKKSQYYIFGGIILIGAVFIILSSTSSISLKKQDESQYILENYVYEARIVIDNAVMKNQNISEGLRNYTESFVEYGRAKSRHFGIVYMYSHADEIYITNFLGESVELPSYGITLGPEMEKVVDLSETLEVKYRNETYFYEFVHPDQIEFKTLLVNKNE